jgi:ABC-2 type transport system ATP-binding protein
MLLAQIVDGPLERLNEIKQFIGAGDLNHAVRRLMDLARDFSDRVAENETVILSGRFNELRTETRRLGHSDDIDRRHSQLAISVLELADKIHDDFVARQVKSTNKEQPPASGSTEREVNRLLTLVRPAPCEAPVDADRLLEFKKTEPETSNALERSRDTFLRKRGTPTGGQSAGAANAAFRCRALGKSYRGSTRFQLSDITLEIVPGQITGLIGVNGSGKTTLLQIIAGVLMPTAGEIEYPTISPGRLNWTQIRNGIAYVQQQPAKWYGRLVDNLYLTAATHGLKGRDNQDEVDFIVHRLGLEVYRDARWTEVSGGYKMRFELARALVSQPSLLVLDEPLAPLDIVTQQLFLQDLRDLANSRRRPLPIVVSSQHLYEIETVADQLLFLEDGKALFQGGVDDVGKDSAELLFELTCPGTRADVERALESFDGFGVDVFGKVFVIRVSSTTTSAEILRTLLNRGFEIRQFRDITHSTRRLFETKGEMI